MNSTIIALLWALSFGFLFYGSILLPKQFPTTFVLGAAVIGSVNIAIVNTHAVSDIVTIYRLFVWCAECLLIHVGASMRLKFALFCPVYFPFITAALRNSSVIGRFARFLTDV
jgi:hypothetical protein